MFSRGPAKLILFGAVLLFGVYLGIIPIPLFFIIFCICAAYIYYHATKDAPRNKQSDQFMSEDMRANNVEEKDIDEQHFIVPDVTVLPFRHDLDEAKFTHIIRSQKAVLEAAERKMIYFSEDISNTKLKFTFGHGSLEYISMCEKNYDKYIWALVRWADNLMQKDMLDDAISVLQHCIDFGPLLSKPYLLLTEIYIKTNNLSEVHEILSKIPAENLQSKEMIEKKIKHLLDQAV